VVSRTVVETSRCDTRVRVNYVNQAVLNSFS